MQLCSSIHTATGPKPSLFQVLAVLSPSELDVWKLSSWGLESICTLVTNNKVNAPLCVQQTSCGPLSLALISQESKVEKDSRWNKGANSTRNRKWKKVRRNEGDSNTSRRHKKGETNIISTDEVTFHLKLHFLKSERDFHGPLTLCSPFPKGSVSCTMLYSYKDTEVCLTKFCNNANYLQLFHQILKPFLLQDLFPTLISLPNLLLREKKI